MAAAASVRVLVGLCCLSAGRSVQDQQPDWSCNAAGVARAGFRDREAVRWLNDENARRAPYYIEQAKRMYEKGLRQDRRIDKTNSDPFIALYDAQHQVLGALDLAPDNVSTWVGAGQATAMIASLSEDNQDLKQKALRMLAKACQLDAKSIDDIRAWAKQKVKDEDDRFTKMKRSIGKKVSSWKKDGIPEVQSMHDFLPVLAKRQQSEVCAQGASMPKLGKDVAESTASSPKDQVKRAVASMNVQPIFPTLITSVNVAQYFGKDFADKLAKIAVTKYRSFSAERKRGGQTDPNDINDAFFSAQNHNWPELHKSKEYQQLRIFLKEALIEHASKTGYPLSKDQLDKTHVSMWAAVYLEDGGRHGYHVHQSSLSSCVFYAKAPPGKTPIMFVDPRGAPPTHDYEQHLRERDFEPMAPFHHNYHFFAEAGDLVCFPSWLVHRVPSHYEKEERVAFPANLQADGFWDAWYRSATLG